MDIKQLLTNEDRDLVLDVADEDHAAHDVGTGPLLVDQGKGDVEAVGDRGRALGTAGVGRDDDALVDLEVFPNVPEERGFRVEVVNRDVEEALIGCEVSSLCSEQFGNKRGRMSVVPKEISLFAMEMGMYLESVWVMLVSHCFQQSRGRAWLARPQEAHLRSMEVDSNDVCKGAYCQQWEALGLDISVGWRHTISTGRLQHVGY